MGADFIFSWVAIKKGKEEEVKEKMLKAVNKFIIPELSKNPKQKILNNLAEGISKELDEFGDFWEEGLNNDFNDNKMPIDEKGEILTEEEARESIKKVINEFFDCLSDRDISWLEHKGDTIYISGGMSYGDSPTDSLDTINKINCLPEQIKKAGGLK